MSLDLFKTLLVVGMVWAHCFQLLSSSHYPFETVLSIYVNIVTFSGFMFAFGWGSEIAYLRKTKSEVKNRLVNNFFVLLSVYYISGIGWHLFMDDPHSILTFAKIVLLWRIPPYSEFLLSFAFLMIAIWLGFDLIVRILESKKLMIYSICFCLLGSFIPYDYIRIPLLGVFIGTTKFACFPILQYSMFFLIGSWLSRNRMKISKREVIVSLIMTGVGSIYTLLTHKLGTRFPPSVFWLSLAWLPICIYCLICNKIHIGGGYCIYMHTHRKAHAFVPTDFQLDYIRH